MSYREASGTTQSMAKKSVEMDTTPSSRFEVDGPKMLGHLKEHGYMVILSIANASQIREATDKLWAFLDSAMGWCRDDSDTRTSAGFAKAGMPATGIIHRSGVGRSDLQWFIRCLPFVQEAFQNVSRELHESSSTSDLLTSFDGINVFRPWQKNPARETDNSWTHVDQGFSQKGFRCVQGFVSLSPTPVLKQAAWL